MSCPGEGRAEIPRGSPAAQLAQLDKRQSAKQEAAGSSPGRTNTQGQGAAFVKTSANG